MVETLLTFVPLVAGWAFLHRQSVKTGWGDAGQPSQPLEVFARFVVSGLSEFAAAMKRMGDLVTEMEAGIVEAFKGT